MPTRPTQAQIEGVVERLIQEIGNRNFDPFVILQSADRAVLHDLVATDRIEADHVLTRLRAAARGVEGWTEARIKKLSLSVYVTAVNQARIAAERAERLSAGAVDAAQRSGTRAKSRRGIGAEGAPQAAGGNGATPQDMIDQDQSMRLMAIGHLLLRRPGRIWFDTFHLCAMSDWDGTTNERVVEARPIDDKMEGRIHTWLQLQDPRLGRAGIVLVVQAIHDVADRTLRNEPVDKLGALVWDKVERLRELFVKGFGTIDNEYHREIARCWMVSMCARVRHPGCKVDTLPVFQGGEGIAKSTALRCIGGKFHREATSAAGEKDFLQAMIGAMLFEVAELHSMSGRNRNAERIKASITNEDDYFRAPYERKPSNHPRTCVWCGTTNDDEWYAEGGPGRRFWSVVCGVIDLKWLQANMMQLWAEAAFYEQLGTDDPRGQWWNYPVDEQRAEMERASKLPIYQERISRQLQLHNGTVYHGDYRPDQPAPTAAVDWQVGDAKGTEWGTLLTTDRIASQFLGMKPEEQSRNRNEHHIGAAMQRLGYKSDHRRIRGSLRANPFVRFWTLEKRRDVEIRDATVTKQVPPF